MVKHTQSVIESSVAFLAALALFIFGYFAVFKTDKLIMLRIKYSLTKVLARKLSDQKWFRSNLKIGGAICMIISLALLIFIIKTLLEQKHK